MLAGLLILFAFYRLACKLIRSINNVGELTALTVPIIKLCRRNRPGTLTHNLNTDVIVFRVCFAFEQHLSTITRNLKIDIVPIFFFTHNPINKFNWSNVYK